MPVNHFIGIDVSKDDFYACFAEGEAAVRFLNTKQGVARFVEITRKRGYDAGNTRIGLESTGAYHYRICLHCRAKGYTVHVLNPLIVNKHTQLELRKTKTDTKDAVRIRHCLVLGFGYPFVDTKETLILKNLVRSRAYLSDMKRKIYTKAKDIRYKENIIESSITSFNQEIYEYLRGKIHSIDQELAGHNQPIQKLLQTIPGLGPVTAATLVAEIGEIGRFPTVKQFTAFIGLDPRVYESGTSVKGKGYITKRGSKLIRTRLFNCTAVAIQRKNIFREYYQKKVSEGKLKMTALVATMHKMARVIYAVWKREEPFHL